MDRSAEAEYLLFELGDCPLTWMHEVPMRRDDDLIRKLMLDFEASDDVLLVCALHNQSPVDDRSRYYHLKLLADAGLLEESGQRGGIFRMTNAGHDFCAAIRDSGIWKKTKAVSADVAGLGLGMMRDVATGFLRAKLTDMGIPLG